VSREKYIINEDGEGLPPTNNTGSGAVAGQGVGNKGEPGKNPKKKKKITILRRSPPINEETMAGNQVFEVEPEFFHKCVLGKKRYAKYVDYVGDNEIGQQIRQYGLSNPGKPIVIRNKSTHAMSFLRYGKY
jgi:hypothetical protein